MVSVELCCFLSIGMLSNDFNNAFLNGNLQEVVYISQQQGYKSKVVSSYVCRLHKALYSLNQAPRACFDKLKGALLKQWFMNLVTGSSLFVLKHKLCIYWCWSMLMMLSSLDQIWSQCKGLFRVLILNSFSMIWEIWTFLAFRLKGITIAWFWLSLNTLKIYLRKPKMESVKNYHSPMMASKPLSLTSGDILSNPKLYRSTVGALQYLTINILDISFVVNKLS